MSDIGVQSSTYEELRTLADELDRLLIDLRAGHSDAGDPRRKRIADFLYKVGRAAPTDLAALRLAGLLGYADKRKRNEWVHLAKTLEDPGSVPKTVELLERLAVQLEARRMETVSKMRGAGR